MLRYHLQQDFISLWISSAKYLWYVKKDKNYLKNGKTQKQNKQSPQKIPYIISYIVLYYLLLIITYLLFTLIPDFTYI